MSDCYHEPCSLPVKDLSQYRFFSLMEFVVAYAKLSKLLDLLMVYDGY